MHHAFGHSSTSILASSAMAGKYSWIGHALLGCHWLGWLMRPAHVDEPPTAGCQPTNWLREPTEKGRGGPALREPEPKSNGFRLMRLLNPDLYTHTRRHGYKHTQKLGTLPSAAFSIEWMGVIWEGAINTATSFPGPSPSCSKCIIPTQSLHFSSPLFLRLTLVSPISPSPHLISFHFI